MSYSIKAQLFIEQFVLFYVASGYLGPGGLANDSPGHNVSDCTGGAASYIDRTVFGIQRIMQGTIKL